jgi:DNA processing protein
MAAMAGMTVVVEAALGSGSLITAELAQEAGRTVGAVPGQITAPSAAGSNELLHAGAHVIRGAQDVLDCMLGTGAVCAAPPGPALDMELARVLSACEEHHPSGDAVASALGMAPARAGAALARLELLGYLRGNQVGTYARTGLAAPADP